MSQDEAYGFGDDDLSRRTISSGAVATATSSTLCAHEVHYLVSPELLDEMNLWCGVRSHGNDWTSLYFLGTILTYICRFYSYLQ